MAAYTVDTAKHATLVASTVDTVTLPKDASAIEVCNRSGVAAIHVTIGTVNPTVDGDDTFVVPAVAGSARVIPTPGSQPTVVRLISSGAPTYSVTRVD